MDILEFIKSRRSIRKFLDKPVEKEHLTKILEAARWAPSAGNCQPWRFIVITDKKKIKKFDPFIHQPWVLKAPAIIVVLAVPEESQKRHGIASTFYIQDCAAATQNILLAAHGLGLGAVWVATFSKEAVRKELEISSQYEIFGMVCVGHFQTSTEFPASSNEFPSDPHRTPKSLEKIAFIENINVPWPPP